MDVVRTSEQEERLRECQVFLLHESSHDTVREGAADIARPTRHSRHSIADSCPAAVDIVTGFIPAAAATLTEASRLGARGGGGKDGSKSREK